MSATVNPTPRVWVACLASYNAGRLVGEWADATDIDEMNAARDRVAAAAIAAAKEAGEWPVYFGQPEEFAIHDYDGFGSLTHTLGEYPSWATVAKIGTLIEQHGDAFTGYVDACEPDLDDDLEERFHEAYQGTFSSDKAFVEHTVEELGWAGLEPGSSLLEQVEPYLDFDIIETELIDHGPYATRPADAGGVHVYNTQT